MLITIIKDIKRVMASKEHRLGNELPKGKRKSELDYSGLYLGKIIFKKDSDEKK